MKSRNCQHLHLSARFLHRPQFASGGDFMYVPVEAPTNTTKKMGHFTLQRRPTEFKSPGAATAVVADTSPEPVAGTQFVAAAPQRQQGRSHRRSRTG